MGRFCHAFPAYTVEAVLAMPSVRFWAMLGTIRQIEAAESLRNLEVAFFAANPGKDGLALQSFQAGLQDQASGAKRTSVPDVGMPTSALSGEMVSHVESGIILERLSRGHRQIEEQQDAWKTGGWAALQRVLEQQRAVNLASP